MHIPGRYVVFFRTLYPPCFKNRKARLIRFGIRFLALEQLKVLYLYSSTSSTIDGVSNVNAITDGRVTEADLTRNLKDALPEWLLEVTRSGPLKRIQGFDYVICLEVAEHIPPESEGVFLENLRSFTKKGLFLKK